MEEKKGTRLTHVNPFALEISNYTELHAHDFPYEWWDEHQLL